MANSSWDQDAPAEAGIAPLTAQDVRRAQAETGGPPLSEDDVRRTVAAVRLIRAGATIHACGAYLDTALLEQLADLAETPASERHESPEAKALLDNEARVIAALSAPARTSLWQRWRDRPRAKRLPWEQAASRAEKEITG